MAEITRHRTGSIIKTVFEILLEHPEGIQARDVVKESQARMTLTEYELGEYPSSPGKPRFDKIIRFSTIGPTKAGWLTKARSEGWKITEEGEAAYRKYGDDPAELMRQSNQRYQAWKRDQPDDETEDIIVEEAGASLATKEEAQESAWAEVERYVRNMTPYEFQDLVAKLLDAMGYHIAWVSPKGPDRGVDIVAYTDPLGAQGPRIKVQVKHRFSDAKTNVDDLRSFIAVLGGDAGIYVSANGFTKDAEAEARMKESERITLLDLDKLFAMWTEYYHDLSEVGRRLLPIEPIYFLSLDD